EPEPRLPLRPPHEVRPAELARPAMQLEEPVDLSRHTDEPSPLLRGEGAPIEGVSVDPRGGRLTEIDDEGRPLLRVPGQHEAAAPDAAAARRGDACDEGGRDRAV